MVTKELVNIQTEIQIAGSVAKVAIRENAITALHMMQAWILESLSGLLKYQLGYVIGFRVKQPKVIIKLELVSSTGTLNSRKSRYTVKRNSL